MKQNKPKSLKSRSVTPHNKDRAREQAGQIKLRKEDGQSGYKKKSKAVVKVKKKF